MPHLVATLIYLSQIYSYYIRGDGSPLISYDQETITRTSTVATLEKNNNMHNNNYNNSNIEYNMQVKISVVSSCLCRLSSRKKGRFIELLSCL